jgi:hypothetical protein
MIDISSVFLADYYGSQKDCCLYLDGKEYCGRLDDEYDLRGAALKDKSKVR